MDASAKGMQEYKLKRIKEHEKLIAEVQNRLKESPGDLDIAETLMTLQVALEELKNGF